MNAKNWDNYVKILKEDCKALFNVDIININSNYKKLINYNNQNKVLGDYYFFHLNVSTKSLTRCI